MGRLNRGYAIAFLLVLIAAYLGMRWTYQRAAPYFQAKAQEFATYTIDDWIVFFRVEDLVGEPDITPVPAHQYPFTITPRPTETPAATPQPTPPPES
ncbi:MAG TPA: hypothetical protein ENK60_04860 [Anaerolineae bacterium]|nr:hypothetical protein [Anaerolineae bacterium]